MARLLTSASFDCFEVVKASLTTFMSFSMEGPFRPDYFEPDSDDTDKQHPFVRWELLRPRFYELVKGKHTPIKMMLILRFPDDEAAKLKQMLSPGGPADVIHSLQLTVTYESRQIRCITGCSYKQFTPDRTIEQAWDDYMADMLHRLEVPFS